jgi:hypothetical protein
MIRKGDIFKVLLHVALPLLIGVVIYLNGRQDTWLNRHLSFLPFFFIHPHFDNIWHRLLVYNLPDFCWDYSFTSALFLWERKALANNKYFPVMILLILLISEAIQIFMPAAFTFDWLDMLAAVLAFSMSWLLNYAK